MACLGAQAASLFFLPNVQQSVRHRWLLSQLHHGRRARDPFNLTSSTASTAVGWFSATPPANGYQALYFNTTGNYNTTIGFGALVSNTTGSNNTDEADSADLKTKEHHQCCPYNPQFKVFNSSLLCVDANPSHWRFCALGFCQKCAR